MTVTDERETKRPWERVADTAKERPQTVGFVSLTVLGIIIAGILWLIEVYDRPPLEFGEPRVVEEHISEDRVELAVQVNVRNVSEQVRCPVIHIAARDREAGDLQDVPATPLDDGMIPPARSQNYRAVFDGITRRDYEEQLDEFSAYVFEIGDC